MTIAIICLKDSFSDLRSEMKGTEGVKVLSEGITSKADRAYLQLEQSQPIEDTIHETLRRDHRVIDYFILGSISPIETTPT